MSFNLLLSTFANNILPIILISGAGFLLGKLITVDSRTLGRVVFYLFSPLLIFDLLLKSKLDYQQAITTIAYTATVITTLCILAFLLGKSMLETRGMGWAWFMHFVPDVFIFFSYAMTWSGAL